MELAVHWKKMDASVKPMLSLCVGHGENAHSNQSQAAETIQQDEAKNHELMSLQCVE